MKERIDKANFKKIWIGFVIAAVIIGCASAVILYSNFHARINAYEKQQQTASTTQVLKDEGNHHDGDTEGFFENGLTVKDKAIIGTTGALCGLTALAYWLLMACWMVQRSRKDGAGGLLFGLLTLFFNLFAVAGYFIYRHYCVRCPKCGKIQKRDALFCRYCGEPVAKECSRCGTIMKPDDKYCRKCGSEL